MHACSPLLVEQTAVFLGALSLAELPSCCSPALLGTRPTASGSPVYIGSLCLAACGLGLVRLSHYSQSTCLCPALCLEQFP